VLGLQAYSDEAGWKILEARDAGEDSQEERRMDLARVAEDSVEDAVGEDLYALGVANCVLAIVLDLGEIVRAESVGEQSFG